jgi:DNA-binding helix-hairpin-helix protein with protein kinase domain
MPLTVLLDDQGRRVSLGSELGRGGEATVYSVEGKPELVAKIYHQRPDAERAEKLSQMVKLQSESLLSLSAWPMGTLRTADRSTVGFLMKNVSRFKDIHLLYSPKSRTREFPPKANWRFLIHTASNVARAFAAIHDEGHVIGDVNQSNVRVSPETAIVNLIDCDSFQISTNGKIYPCEVGVPLYTPPELQNTEFREVVRTPNHDNFGLAVLIFHLLFMGRHPFAGKYFGRGEMPIERAIAEQRFAFAKDQQRTQMLPPPACITLAHLPEEIGELFASAFGSDGGSSRSNGRQWTVEMDALASRLIICSKNKAHLFFNGLASCPWCSIEASGVLLFVDYTIVDTATGFSVDVVWTRILAIPSPGAGNAPSMVTYISAVEPSLRAKAIARRKRYVIVAGVVAILAALTYGVLSYDGIGNVFAVLIFAAPIIGALKDLFDWSGEKQFSAAARAAEARLRGLQHSWQIEASDEEFNGKLDELRTLTEEYRRLPEQRKRKIREIEQGLRETQMHRYLEQFDISLTNIPYIKEGRRAMLSSYGIDSAADLTRSALEGVPGFGSFLIAQLLNWRQSLEATFKFNPGQGIDPADIQRVDRDIVRRRGEIEGLLSKGPSELNVARQRVIAARGRLRDQLEKALMDVAQAQADESVAA